MNLTEYKQGLLWLAAFYTYKIPQEQLTPFANWLAVRMSIDELMFAVNRYAEDPKNEYFPRPISKLMGYRRPTLSDDDMSVDIATRILGAVRKFGHTGYGEAKTYMGEVGQLAVERMGGWFHLCHSLNSENQNMMFAQFRTIAKSLLSQAHLGLIDTVPALPAPRNQKQLSTHKSQHETGIEAVKQLAHQKKLT